MPAKYVRWDARIPLHMPPSPPVRLTQSLLSTPTHREADAAPTRSARLRRVWRTRCSFCTQAAGLTGQSTMYADEDESAGGTLSRDELLHLANALSDLFDQQILEHPAVLANTEARAKAERISEILTGFRQAAGGTA